MENNFILSADIKEFITSQGANKVGFCDLDGFNLPSKYHRAISILVLLSPNDIHDIGKGPNIIYGINYEAVNAKLTEISIKVIKHLNEQNYLGEAIEPEIGSFDKTTDASKYPHKGFAYKSGLGWIGKSTLLVNKEYGSAFRLATILTDAPLRPNSQLHKNHCGSCQICRDTCPANAIKGEAWNISSTREDLFDAKKCFDKIKTYMEKLEIESPICGICMRKCPWTDHYLKRYHRSNN